METEIYDFAEILAPQDGYEPPVVVGGHAVNLWSGYYLDAGVGELAAFMPFTSKDLDLIGSAGLLDRLHILLKGTITRSEPRSPVLGRLEAPRKQGGVLTIEVLHTVKGLDAKDLARTMEVRIGGVAAQVLLPHLILKAKIENVVTIPQDGRSDLKHVRMMILCVRAFISELVGFLPSGRISERVVVNLLEETLGIISGSPAEKAAKMWHFDFSNVWPWEKLRETGDGKVARWLEHRFPRHR